MVVAAPPTPPSTAPTSPTLMNAPCVIDIPESGRACYDEKRTYSDSNRTPVGKEPITHNFSGQFKSYFRKASFSVSPHFPWRRRKSDGAEMLVQRIDDHPNGYPQLAAFMDSDSNFLMCRRFGFLHSRVLLYRQDELTDLENKLIDMDGLDKDELPLALRSRKIDDERNDIEEQYTRKTLINTIDQKLKEYDDIVRRVRSFVSMKRPSKRNFKSFYDWILGIKPLSREETDFVKHGEDFVALADAEEGGWFDGVVEDCLSCLPGGLAKKLLTSPEQLKKSDDAYVHLYSKYRVDVIVRLTLTIITVLLLMAPTAALYLVHGHAKLKIVLIVIFTLLFSLALGVFTKAKRHEMFAATAA